MMTSLIDVYPYTLDAKSSLALLDEGSTLQELATINPLAFPDDATAISAYLAFSMEIFQMRTAFISELSARAMYVLAVADADAEGCGIRVDTTVPLKETFCQYVRASAAPVLITDAATDPRVMNLAARRDCMIGSYIGVPLVLMDGTLYGALCVLDPNPHTFSATQVAVLRIIARSIVAIIERTTIQPILKRAFTDVAMDISTVLAALDAQTMVAQIVAHDVCSPLMTINGYSDLLQEGAFGQLAPDQYEVVQCMQQATKHVTRLINDLVDVHPVHHHCFTLITEPMNPLALAQDLVAAYRFQAITQGVQLSIVQNATIPSFIGDAGRLRQVLCNLLSNALRYTPQGWVRLVIDTYDGGVEFRVEDSGIGIAPDIQDAIWTRYTRGTSIGTGSGLGLYVVQELVQAMGGTVGMTSVVGVGSRFWVRLPRQGSCQ